MRVDFLENISLGYENKFCRVEYPLYFFQISDFSSLQKRMINKIDEIEKIVETYDDVTLGDGNTKVIGATQSHNLLNFLDYEEFSDLSRELNIAAHLYQNDIWGIQTPLFYKAWGNKLPTNGHLSMHSHMSDFALGDQCVFSLHLTVRSSPKNRTVYKPISNSYNMDIKESGSFQSENIEGQITIFPSNLSHYTTPNVDKDYRYSFAMDITSNTPPMACEFRRWE